MSGDQAYIGYKDSSYQIPFKKNHPRLFKTFWNYFEQLKAHQEKKEEVDEGKGKEKKILGSAMTIDFCHMKPVPFLNMIVKEQTKIPCVDRSRSAPVNVLTAIRESCQIVE